MTFWLSLIFFGEAGLFSFIVLSAFFKERKASAVVQSRKILTDDEIFQDFYASSGFGSDDVIEIWHEIAEVFDIPAGCIRPEDRFGRDIGLSSNGITNENLDTLEDYAAWRCKKTNMAANLASVVTVDDYVRYFLENKSLKNKESITNNRAILPDCQAKYFLLTTFIMLLFFSVYLWCIREGFVGALSDMVFFSVCLSWCGVCVFSHFSKNAYTQETPHAHLSKILHFIGLCLAGCLGWSALYDAIFLMQIYLLEVLALVMVKWLINHIAGFPFGSRIAITMFMASLMLQAAFHLQLVSYTDPFLPLVFIFIMPIIGTIMACLLELGRLIITRWRKEKEI